MSDQTEDELCQMFQANCAIPATRGENAKKQEVVIESMLNGLPFNASGFPCSREILEGLRDSPPGEGYKAVGGLSSHHDGVFSNGETVELKVTKKKGTPQDVLRYQPWKDTVQFLQGQIKSKHGEELFGDLYKAWYDKEIAPHWECSYEEYLKASFDFGTGEKDDTPAEQFIALLRGWEDLQQEYQEKWLRFEEEYFELNPPNIQKLKTLISDTLKSKTWWICISKTYAVWTRGPTLIDIVYEVTKTKPNGGKMFQYSLTLEQCGGQKTVPLSLKFHWKNGGQAVQNLNFMLV